jgi:post-segregation antitoxin (ccd killing protein)
VSPWRADAHGAVITLSHPFVGQDDLVRRLTDLAGPNGVLRDPRITHERGWFRTTDAVAVTVDLRAPSAGVSSDTALAGRLRAAGVNVSSLEHRLESELRNALTVQVAVHAPAGHVHTVTVRPGGQARASVTSTRFELDRAITLGIGATLAFLALLFFGAAAVGKRRERRRRRARGPAHANSERIPLM